MISTLIIGSLLLCITCVSSGIIRQDDIPLLANERISKRSLPDSPPVLLERQKRMLLQEQLRTPILEDLEPSANTAMAYYRRRRGRSVDTLPLLREDDAESTDLDTAENVVFFPFFRSTRRRIINRRVARDIARVQKFPTGLENESHVARVQIEGKVGQDGTRRKIE